MSDNTCIFVKEETFDVEYKLNSLNSKTSNQYFVSNVQNDLSPFPEAKSNSFNNMPGFNAICNYVSSSDCNEKTKVALSSKEDQQSTFCMISNNQIDLSRNNGERLCGIESKEIHIDKHNILQCKNLNQHIIKFQCSFCFASEQSSFPNIQVDENLFACTKCYKNLKQKTDCRKVEKLEKLDSKYNCKHCNLVFLQKSSFLIHMKLHTNCEPLCGLTLEKEVKQEANLVLNSLSDKKSFVCRICDKVFKRRNTLSRHEMEHTAIKPFVCEYCDKKFFRKEHLLIHVRTHTGEKPFSCPTCSKRFGHKTSLVDHAVVHTGEKPFVCNTCNKSFSFKSSLRKHMKAHSGIKPHACEYCDKKFTRKSGLNLHIKTHTGEKLIVCSVCNKRFKTRSILTIHSRIHTGIKPFMCPTCGKSFTQKSGLSQHFRVHTGEKPFACSICNKRFQCKKGLKRHEKIHKGVKSFVCEYCDKRFMRKDTLTSHRRTHGENRFLCTICCKSYSQKYRLHIHMKMHTTEKS